MCSSDRKQHMRTKWPKKQRHWSPTLLQAPEHAGWSCAATCALLVASRCRRWAGNNQRQDHEQFEVSLLIHLFVLRREALNIQRSRFRSEKSTNYKC